MKTARLLTAIFIVIFVAGHALAQGSLIPPGVPGATMKTLDQVEPRTPISSAGYTITQSGSYYLTTNLTAGAGQIGITVAANDVTIDLNGFTLDGAGIGTDGINQGAAYHQLTIRNGMVKGWSGKSRYGIRLLGEDAVLEDLQLSGNLTAVSSAGYATLWRCEAVGNNSDGFNLNQGMVLDCRAADNFGDGIEMASNGVVRASVCANNGKININVSGSGCTIEDNKLTGGATGMTLQSGGNRIANNEVYGATDNYDLAQGNQLDLLLCEIPETLDWPCSVKLAGTLTCTQTGVDGITVNSDNVTIDMDGHALIGPGESSGHGIYQSLDYRNLTVVNGKATHWGATGKGGLYLNGQNGTLENVAAHMNYYGIHAGNNWSMRACVAAENTRTGIDVERNNTLENCASTQNGWLGIYADSGNTLQNCTAFYNTQGGINATDANTLQNCSAHFNGGTGIRVMSGNTIQNCSSFKNSSSGFYAWIGNNIQSCKAYDNDLNGIQVEMSNNIRNCAARDNIGHGFSSDRSNFIIGCFADNNGYYGGDRAGIYVSGGYFGGGKNRIEGNNVIDNELGICVEDPGNFIVRNTCSDNTTNWVVAAGNVCLVVDASTTGSAISGDSGGTAPGSTDPNANYTY